MKLRCLALRLAVAVLGVATFAQAHATTFASGTFSKDNSSASGTFTVSSAQNYTFNTTSFAAGGFLPVLTLFSSTGAPIDYSNSGLGDVSISDLLMPGMYSLYITEYPNVAIGNLSDGFLFSSDPTATGDACGGAVTGKMFINATTCSAVPLGSNYSVNLTTSAVPAVPEPSSFLLMLAPAAGVLQMLRRRR